MPTRNNRPFFNFLVTIPVALIVLGAITMCGTALLENMRFIKSTNQILWVVSAVRTVAAQQKDFAQTAGANLWDDLAGAGQMAPSSSHANPWGNEISAVAIGNASMRVESDLPTHDCRRLILYFLGRNPTNLGLVTIEARAESQTRWTPVYPLPTASSARLFADVACGQEAAGRVAFVFKVR